MDTATWMQMGGLAGLGAALLAGFLFSFTPVAFASIPVVLAYAIGRVIPLAIGAISIGWLENLQLAGGFRRAFEVSGGITLMAVGLYLLNEYYFWI
ncbi:MAG: hypothetical protein WD709_01675 [Gammaproteobacteria bacterium]